MKLAGQKGYQGLAQSLIRNPAYTYKLGVLSIMHKYFYENLPASFHDMFNSLAIPNITKSYKLERVLFKTLECFPSALFPKI